MATPQTQRTASPAPSLTRYAWLSIAAAIVTIGLKTYAYLLTGSVGLLSDAAESVVNLVAAVIALVALIVAARPADESHQFGHGKAEYFSAAIETLSFAITSGCNGAVGWLLVARGRQHRSATLVADGKHLLTDVWTSAGVVVGVGLVAVTGWLPLDALVAIAVAVNILVVGTKLVVESVSHLLDAALAADDIAAVHSALDPHRTDEVSFHGLQTRVSGRQRFVSVHVLVPGEWSVQHAHDIVETIEDDVRAALEDVHVTTHVEPREDARSYDDYDYDSPAP